jgi:hypothetical protein
VSDIFHQISVNTIRAHLRCGLLQHLLEFGRINIRNAMLDHDHTHALAALVELRRIYVALDMVWPEDFFGAEVKAIDAGLDRIVEGCRGSVLRQYVRTKDPDEVMDLSETLSKAIAHDRSWDWQAEFDQALAEQMAS